MSKINKINLKRHDVDFRFLTFECDCRERDMISSKTCRRCDRECVITTHDERDERRLTLTRVRDSVSLKATATAVKPSRGSRCRRKTEMSMFKASFIRHVFEKFDMWWINEKQCIKQLKHFNKHVETTKLTLSLLRQTHDLINIQHELKNQWDFKIANNMQRSDLVRKEKFQDFINSTKQIIVNSLFKETKLQMWQTTRQKELNRKKFFRKRLRFETDNLKLIKENAKQVIVAKLQKKKNDEKKRIDA